MQLSKRILSLSLPLLAAGVATAFALQDKDHGHAGAQGDNVHEMPKPTKEHAWIKSRVGTWDCVVSCPMMGEPLRATETNEAFGDFWIVSKFQGDFMGHPMKGLSLLGYDPMKEKYVSTWCDTMSPALFVMEGTMDAANKKLTSTGMGPNMEGQLVEFTNVVEVQGPDAAVFTMYETSKGADSPEAMKIEYKRKK
jgi:hypothetical protein